MIVRKEQEKYRLRVVSIGQMAEELFSEGLLIFFGDGAPGELQEVSIIHQHSDLPHDIEAGDSIIIDASSYSILCIGSVVNENIRNIGHMVIKFNGLDSPENLGDINVEQAELPDIRVGTEVVIKGKNR